MRFAVFLRWLFQVVREAIRSLSLNARPMKSLVYICVFVSQNSLAELFLLILPCKSHI